MQHTQFNTQLEPGSYKLIPGWNTLEYLEVAQLLVGHSALDKLSFEAIAQLGSAWCLRKLLSWDPLGLSGSISPSSPHTHVNRKESLPVKNCIWCCKPVWALTKVWPKKGQARVADAKACLADPQAPLAHSQPPLGILQSGRGLAQSPAGPISSKGATHAKRYAGHQGEKFPSLMYRPP
ncbi:hypothetical protein PTTG_27585 [Puccinia triticina 1-1 BBBD Race 1]|uniref:Uncharacterized protein n=1 Tax=Puccinia triticina (isolate 1-1 / race 1 (BBBD)) TaxID=630390 RepID=A0A180GK02_PUCT1|nr:hypothetical protein PTTG_27585 [Puccinia triticina 1-1 BBBD Race 1]